MDVIKVADNRVSKHFLKMIPMSIHKHQFVFRLKIYYEKERLKTCF